MAAAPRQALAPFLIRLALAATFLWAGMGKVLGTLPVGTEQAATLRAMGEPPVAHADPATGAETFTTRWLHGIALGVHAAANPAPAADGSTPRPIWPAWAAAGNMPVILAWAATVTELVAGLFLLVGLLTRLSGLAVAGVMLVAMWLTQIGPAVQSGGALLGFLPDASPWYVADAYQTLLWQFMLLCAGLALFFTGGGSLALDAAGHRRDDEFADDDEDDDSDD